MTFTNSTKHTSTASNGTKHASTFANSRPTSATALAGQFMGLLAYLYAGGEFISDELTWSNQTKN